MTLMFLEFSLSYGRPEGFPDILVSTWIVQTRTNDHGDAAKEEFEAVVGGIDGRSAQAEGSFFFLESSFINHSKQRRPVLAQRPSQGP